MSGGRARAAPGGSDGAARPGLDLRLLLPALAAWAVGAASLAIPLGAKVGLGAVFGSAAALVLWRGAGRRGLVPLSLAAMGLVCGASGAHTAVREAGPVAELARAHAQVRVVGGIRSDPVVTSAHLGGSTVRLRMLVTEVRAHGQVSSVATPVLVVADEAWLRVRWRETVSVRGRLVSAAPGDDVVAVFHPIGKPVVVSQPGVVARAAEHLRAGLRSAAAPLPPDARGLLPALVIGDTSRTPQDLTEAMRATGMTHLSAVSGSNVAIILALALGSAAACGVPRRWRPAIALGVLAGFVVLARPEPSVVRAATMGAIGLIGLSRSRRAAGIPVLSAAVVVLLVVDPWLSRSYGFALSTLATLGLLLFAGGWGRAIGSRLPGRLRVLGSAIAIPVAAQVTCGPVIVLLQGSVSIIGVLANLLAAPLVAPATISGVLAAAVAPVWAGGATALCWLGAIPALGIAWTARTCAAVPGGTLPWPDGPPGAVLLVVITVLVLLTGQWWIHQIRLHPLLTLTGCLLVVAASAPTSALTWPPPGWRFVACDVGQGDGLVLAPAPGHAVLVDAGPDPAMIDRCLRRLHIGVLDAIVLSHFHADHVDGLPGALAGRDVREILATPIHEPPYQWREVAQWAGARGIPIHDLYAGDHLGWAGLSADVWWPARRIEAGSVPNNASVVLAVRSGPVDLLMLGDVEREAAHAVLLELRRDPSMAARAGTFDVVKAPHHGSANIDEQLMAVVRAPIAVISVGKDNDYGHPSPKALQVLRRNGYGVYRTDERGDVAVVAVGQEVGVTWRGR